MLSHTSSRAARRLVAGFAVASALAVGVPAAAATPSKAAAVAAARAEARTLARQTHASSYRVLGCRKSTPTRYVCQIENTFRTGASRCTADVVVSFRAGRARTSYSNYVCY